MAFSIKMMDPSGNLDAVYKTLDDALISNE